MVSFLIRNPGRLLVVTVFCLVPQFQCLTFFRDNNYQWLEFESDPPEADVLVMGNGEVLYRARTPARLEVRKARGYLVRFEKQGFYPAVEKTDSQIDWKLFFLSFVGWLPGILFDLGTGASSKIVPAKILGRLEKLPPLPEAKKPHEAEHQKR